MGTYKQLNKYMLIPPFLSPSLLGDLPDYNLVSSDSTQDIQPRLNAQAACSNYGSLLPCEEIGSTADYWELIWNQQFSQKQDTQL
jgi:hypothetical protein